MDFYHFTSLLMRTLDESGRPRIVAMMWEMVLADGRVSEFEDNVLWRVADLLGISNRQRIELRGRSPRRSPWGRRARRRPGRRRALLRSHGMEDPPNPVANAPQRVPLWDRNAR